MESADVACPGRDLKPLREDEIEARDVFGPHIDGELFAVTDPPDFILCRDGRVVGWAEATSAVDEATQKFSAWVQKNGATHPAPQLNSDWLVAFKNRARMNDLRIQELVEGLLVPRERLVRRLNDVLHDGDTLEGRNLFRKLGLKYAMSMQRSGRAARVHIISEGSSSRVDASLIAQLAEEKSSLKAASLADRDGERHLLILVSYAWHSGAGFALADWELEMPHAPDLPTSITDVWLSSHKNIVWHFSQSRGEWRVLTS